MNRSIYKFYEILKYKRFDKLVYPGEIFNFLLESQYWDRKKLTEYQLNCLNELLVHAKKSKFYSELYHNVRLPLSSLEQMKTIPLVTKADLQNCSTDLAIGEYLKSGWFVRSSGSTGSPTTAYISQLAIAYRNATKWRFFGWWGFSQYDRWVNFTAYPRNSSTLNRIKSLMTPRLDIDIFSLNDTTAAELLRKIVDYKPKYFRGYVSALANFGRLVKQKNLSISGLHLKAIIVTSEILYESDREFIESVFNCKVVNEYGAAEGGLFACECPDGGMHIQEESLFVFTGENDELVSTELHNKLMPLINYKVGDKVVLADRKCKCGRELSLIESIEGRIGSDEIITSDGRRLNYLFFDRMIKNLARTKLWGQIKKFQIVQDGSTFYCNIIKNENYTDDIEMYIKDYIKHEVGESTRVVFVYKNEIETEKSGKFRIFKRISN